MFSSIAMYQLQFDLCKQAIGAYQSFVYTKLHDQTVLFQTIQFSLTTQFKC